MALYLDNHFGSIYDMNMIWKKIFIYFGKTIILTHQNVLNKNFSVVFVLLKCKNNNI